LVSLKFIDNKLAVNHELIIFISLLTVYVQTLLRAFKTYVLSVIEYASSVWSPHPQSRTCSTQIHKASPGLQQTELSRQTRQVKIGKPWSQTSATWFDLDLQDSFWAHRYESKWLFHICWQNSQYKRSCLQTPPSHCRVDVRKCFFTDRVQKPWDSLPVELHHFSSLSVSSVLFLVLICLSLLHVRFYPPLGRGICFTVWFFFVFFFVRFLVNDFSTTRGPIHAKFCMRAYSSSGCLIPFWGLAAPGGGKRGKCPMRMVGLCHFYWRTC